MSCPLGETGVGKMGEIPPSPSQELRRKAAAARPTIVSGNRPRCFTAQSLSEEEGPEEARLTPLASRGEGWGVGRELARPSERPSKTERIQNRQWRQRTSL